MRKNTGSIAQVLLVTAACAVSTASRAADGADALDALRRRGDEFCFGRTYDASHMARHRTQRLSAFFLFRDFSPDPLSEDKPIPRDRLIAIDKSTTHRTLDVLKRNRAGRIERSELRCDVNDREVTCSGDSGEGEDGVLEVRTSRDALLVKNGLESERYALGPLPISTCLAWRDRARPKWVGQGPPLRVRFAEHAPACFMREYDARYLAKHPKENVAGVAVRINRPVEIDDSDRVRHTMLRVTLSMRLRDGTLAERNTRCDGSGYDFWCQGQYGSGAVFLVPAGDRSIMMLERRRPDERRGKGPMETFFGVPLGHGAGPGARAFRLDAHSETLCELREQSEVRPRR